MSVARLLKYKKIMISNKNEYEHNMVHVPYDYKIYTYILLKIRSHQTATGKTGLLCKSGVFFFFFNILCLTRERTDSMHPPRHPAIETGSPITGCRVEMRRMGAFSCWTEYKYILYYYYVSTQ